MRKYPAPVLLLFVLLIPLCLHAGDATPQTRQEIIQIEGMEETVTTTYTQGTKGYAMWIDTDYLVLQPEDEGSDIDVYVSPHVIPGFVCELLITRWSAWGYSFEQAIEDTRQNLMENYGNANTLENVDLFNGLRAGGFYSIDRKYTLITYLAEAEAEVFYYFTIRCPHEAAEGFASRVIWMLRSFEHH